MTAAEFERLPEGDAASLLRTRLRTFLGAGAALTGALVLAVQVEIPEEDAAQLLRQGLSADLVLRLLY